MSERQTEQSGSYHGIDTWPDHRILDALLSGQERAVAAVRQAAPSIAQAATVLAQRLAAGGRLIYAGAGTSVRLAVQDGSELPATFGMPEDKILYVIAGGRAAMFDTLADAEDDEADGAAQAEACRPGDTFIAVAASGFMRGARLHVANQRRSCVGSEIGTESFVNASTNTRLIIS